jgi:hypothetical protein
MCFVILSPIQMSLCTKYYIAHNTESFSTGQSDSPDGGKSLQVVNELVLHSKWMSKEIINHIIM